MALVKIDFLGLMWHALHWLEGYHVYLRRKGGPRFWMLVGWSNDFNLFGVFRLFMCGRWPSYVGVIMFIGFVITIASFIFNLHHQSIIFCFLFFKNNNNNKNLSPKVPIYLDLVQLCVVYI